MASEVTKARNNVVNPRNAISNRTAQYGNNNNEAVLRRAESLRREYNIPMDEQFRTLSEDNNLRRIERAASRMTDSSVYFNEGRFRRY